EEGDRVPADCRLSRATGLAVDQAALTGESQPQPRQVEAIALSAGRSAPPARECTNLLLAGTTVVTGRAEAFVYATGAETEFGQVARLTAGTRRGASTLERQVARILHTISAVAVSMGMIAFALCWLFVGLRPLESLVFAVGIIVANVPEGLLPTVTLSLALSVQRMARRQALVRRLSAVETLGSVSVICCDKTGTLTQGRMALEESWLPMAGPQARRLLLLAASLCSNADPLRGGDPTELALFEAAKDGGLDPDVERRRQRRLAELPFDFHRRRMSVVVAWQAALPPGLDRGAGATECRLLITKGAPLEVLEHCNRQLGPLGVERLLPASGAAAHAAHEAMAGRGQRVLAVALRLVQTQESVAGLEAMERDLVLVGLVGLYDPPRPDVPRALQCCREAGIRVAMVTGDHGRTAEAIARQIGLLEPTNPQQGNSGADPVRVIEGTALAAISDLQLRQLLRYRQRLVFARMAPEQKLRLVQAYRALGEVVAVTGDGVNDAPALRAADVGLAMVALGIPAALTVLQILAVDLGTDLLPALGLGAEPPEHRVMDQLPRPRQQALLDRRVMVRAYLVLGLSEAVLAMGGYLLVWRWHGLGWAVLRELAPLLLHHRAPVHLEMAARQASSVAFATIVAGQMGALLACRSERQPFWQLLDRPNRWLWLGLLSEPLLAALLVLLPALAAVIALAPFPLAWLGWIAIAPLVVLLADTAQKALLARARGDRPAAQR
ncbi:MAG: cation-translocating P-type ATPase, partial [Cyanobium sp.]